MSSDDIRPRRDVSFRPAGTGMAVLKTCDACHLPKSMQGGKYPPRRTMRRVWHCAACVAKKAAA